MIFSPADEAGYALWLIVPVKPFGEGKSRLANAVPAALRAELSQRWLTHVLTTAQRWGRFAGIAVISRDPAVLNLAQSMGCAPIVEMGEEFGEEFGEGLGVEGDDTLNAALRQARAVVTVTADATLVLPSDLPLLTVEDLDELYELAEAGEGVVIAPSHDGGTNALLLRPPQAMAFAFGEASFARHLALAAAAGLPCHVYQSASLALDVDRPEDLLLVNR